MDERTLTEDKIKTILESKYKGDIIFAFDSIDDKEIIEEKSIHSIFIFILIFIISSALCFFLCI